MIKVCHLTSVHNSDDVRVFKKECTSLAKAGFEVYLVAKGESRQENGVTVVGLGDAPKSRIKRILFFTQAVLKEGLKLDCDLYQIHDPELLPIALKLKKHGKKVVFDSHENYYEQLLNKPYLSPLLRKIVANVYVKYETKVLRKIDGGIYTNLNNGKHPFEGRCKNIETIDNYPMLCELYDKYDGSIEKRPRSACYVGSLTENRGVTNFVKSAYLAKSFAYLGGVYYSEEYEKTLKSMPEYSCVKDLGKLNRDQVLDLLQHTIVGMATLRNVGQYNKDDNLATKVYEYMSLALPVILSSSKYNDKVMEEYKFGICVDPDDIEGTAKALEYLYANPDIAAQMGANGRKAVFERFNWESESEKLVALYRKIIS